MTGTPLAIIGMGKMGRALVDLAGAHGFTVVATLDRAHPVTRESLAGAAVAIEFSTPESAVANILACIATGCPVVVGTTGWYDAMPRVRAEVDRAGGTLLYAPNFSLGVAIFDRVVAEAARLFGSAGFSGHLVETHHAAKKDAPSGTAASLARTVEAASNTPMPITSVRVGSVPGTHEVIFDSPFEQVRLVHEARDRRVFADGALAAATWLIEGGRGQRRGVFTMQDIISTPVSASHHQ